MVPKFWLWAGVVGGLALTLVSVLWLGRSATIPDTEASAGSIIARVNGRPIRGEELDRVLSSLRESDPNIEVSAAMRREILNDLIGEELLIQQAVELGLAYKDPVTRRLLVRSMIESAAGGAEEEEPSEKELREFFSNRRSRFQRDGRVRIEHVFVRSEAGRDESAHTRAASAARAWGDGKSWSDVKSNWGDAPIMEVPAGLLPIDKLREYVGPTAARTAAESEVGTVSAPVKATGGYHVLKVVEREEPSIPRFEEVRGAVVRAYSEDVKSKKVEAYVKDLRSRARIDLMSEIR